jgi:SAM-dependent methyltransferase
MTLLAEKLKNRFYRKEDHPYRLLTKRIAQYVNPEATLLDAGCGYTAPVLASFRGQARKLIGVDVVDFKPSPETEGLDLIKGNIEKMDVPSGSVDVMFSRSVMEHVDNPREVYREMHRVLKPGGHSIFLTANLWDYVSLVASVVPNRFHAWIVNRTEGRPMEDTFPTRYRTNTRGAVDLYAKEAGFSVTSFEYLGQYPNMFMFNAPLFLLGTVYEKVLAKVDALAFLRGWILVDLKKD